MFKKTNRLSKSEFTELFNKGKKQHLPHLTIITLPANKTKVAVVVGKKVAKSAVKRNTLRRRVYASLKNLDPNNKTLGDLIVILKPSFNSLPRKSVDEVIRQSFAQLSKGA